MENEAELRKRIVELEAQLEKSLEEHVELNSKVERSLDKYHKLKAKEKTWKEKFRKAELDQKMIAVDLNLSITKLKESDAELHRLNCLVDERDATIKASIVKIEDLEKLNSELEMSHRESRLADNRRLEEKITELFLKNEALKEAELESRLTENRKSEEMISELHRKIEELERVRTERDSKIRVLDKRIAGLIGALEEEEKRTGKATERIKGLEGKKKALEEKANSELERVKREMEVEYERKVLELSSRVEDYVREIEATDASKDREFMEKMEFMEKEKVDLIAMDLEQIEEMLGLNPAKSAMQNQGMGGSLLFYCFLLGVLIKICLHWLTLVKEVVGSSTDKDIPSKEKRLGSKCENASEMCDAIASNDELGLCSLSETQVSGKLEELRV